MAEEVKKVITIETGASITSIKDFKHHIEELRGSLLGLDQTSEEYAKISEQIAADQAKLNSVMAVGKKTTDAVAGSYNDLNNQLKEAKKQWKALSDVERNGATGKELQQKISGLDTQLKELDSSIGQYQRNVGDYEGAFGRAFASMKDSIVAAVPAVGKLGIALKSLATNPVGLVITAVAAAIALLVKSIKGSESQLNRFKVATAGVHAAFDTFKNILSKVSELIIKLTEKIGELITKGLNKLQQIFSNFGWNKMAEGVQNFVEKIEEYQEIEQKSIDLGQQRRSTAIAVARAENEAAKYQAEIMDTENNTLEQRLEFIDKWEKAEKNRAALQVSLAQAEYNEIKRRNALTESSTEDLDAENAAYVALIQAQGEYDRSMKSIIKTKQRLIREQKAAAEAAEKEELEALNKLIEAEVELQRKEEEREKKQHEADITGLEDEAKQALFLADLEIENESDKAARIYEINRQLLEDKIALQEEYLSSNLLNIEEQLAAEKKLADMRKELNNLDLTENKRQRDEAKKTAEYKKARAYEYANAMSDVFGAIGDMMEDNSEEQKAFQIMEATVSTLASVVGVVSSVWNDPTIPSSIAKAALSAALGGAVLAQGIAQIAKIKSTTKNSAGSGLTGGEVQSVSVPNVGATPLYDENYDMARLTSLSVQGNSYSPGNQQVYVLESDIEEVGKRVEVRENNATF